MRTRVGYTGGESDNPEYRTIGNHSEAIQIDYDPQAISYSELLDIFWENHDPTTQSWSQQYKTAVYYHNKAQKRIAEESRNNLASTMKSDIVTLLLPLTDFFLAEDYHQKYRLRNHSALMEEFEVNYPRVEDLISSRSAARVNGYLGGNGTCDQLKSEIHSIGLSESGSKKLLKEVCRRDIEMFCPTKNCS